VGHEHTVAQHLQYPRCYVSEERSANQILVSDAVNGVGPRGDSPPRVDQTVEAAQLSSTLTSQQRYLTDTVAKVRVKACGFYVEDGESNFVNRLG
jgi:hypothetical protein